MGRACSIFFRQLLPSIATCQVLRHSPPKQDSSQFSGRHSVRYSTHWNQAHALVLLITRDALGTRIEGEYAIDQECVAVVSVLEF